MKLNKIKEGYIVIKSPLKNEYEYASTSSVYTMGIYSNGSLVSSGTTKVYVHGVAKKGQNIRSRIDGDGGMAGQAVIVADGFSTSHLQIGMALETGRDKLISVALNIRYISSTAGYIQGTGTVNTIAKFTAADTVGNSGLSDDGTNITSTENFKVTSDSKKIYLGAGGDMTMWYDGTDGHVKTSDVAASDLVIDCGTDKTIRLGETVWDDSMVAPTAFRSGSTSLTFAALTATIWTHRWDVGDEVHIAVQFPHSLSVNTSIVPHVHIINKNAIGATAYNVAFDFYYTWANIGSVFPGELSELNVKQSFQNASALTHKMLNFTALTPTAVQGGISSIFLARILRVAASVEAYNTADIFTLGFDIHFQKDTMGSRQTAIK